MSYQIWLKSTLHKSQSSNCELFYFHHDYIEVFDTVLPGRTQPAKIWYPNPPHPSCGSCVGWCSGVGVVVAAAAAAQDMDFSIFPLVCTPQSNYQLTHCKLRVSDYQLHNYNIT